MPTRRHEHGSVLRFASSHFSRLRLTFSLKIAGKVGFRRGNDMEGGSRARPVRLVDSAERDRHSPVGDRPERGGDKPDVRHKWLHFPKPEADIAAAV